MADVHVVGAGPAGSIASICALREGHSVVISEEHSAAGIPKNCSGLFSKDGLETLKPFVDYEKHVINPIKGAHINLMDQKLSIRRDTPVSFVCDRTSIDMELASKAESHGAKINYREKIKNNFLSKSIIGADGPFSMVARKFGFKPIQRHVSTLQLTAKYKSDDPNMVEVFLSNSRFPGFFGWIIPQDEYTAEFGVGVQTPSNPLIALKTLLKIKNIESKTRPEGHTIPISLRQCTALELPRYNIMLVGDAAGQVKSTTGGGVIFGGNCAALAGKYIQKPLGYEFEWRMRFGTDLFVHSTIQKYMSSLSDEAMSVLGKRLKKLNCDSYLSNYGHMDRPTKMMGPNMISHILKTFMGVS